MAYRPTYEIRERIDEISVRINKIENQWFKSKEDKNLISNLMVQRGNLEIELKGREIEENEQRHAERRQKEIDREKMDKLHRSEGQQIAAEADRRWQEMKERQQARKHDRSRKSTRSYD